MLLVRKLLRRVLTTVTFSLDSVSSKTEVPIIPSMWAGVTLEALKQQGQPSLSHTHTHCHQHTNLWGAADHPSTEMGPSPVMLLFLILLDTTTTAGGDGSWGEKVWDGFGSLALNATWSPSFGVLHLSLRWDDSKSGVARTCWERGKIWTSVPALAYSSIQLWAHFPVSGPAESKVLVLSQFLRWNCKLFSNR